MATTPHDNQGGFYLNTKTISAIVGVCTIVAFLFSVFDRVRSYEYRLDKVEYSDSMRSNDVKVLTTELKALNSKLTDLTIELREMRAAQRVLDLDNEKVK